MNYGKLQGEVVAAGHVAGSTAAASLIQPAFNALGASVISTGLYAVTLGDGVDPANCAVLATADSTPGTVTANNSGLDTDTVKRFTVVDAAGVVLGGSGFYFVVVRTNVS